MPVAYPSSLPTILRASKVRRQEASFRASELARGYGHFEASGTDHPFAWDVTFRFTKTEAAIFMRWFVDDLNEGLLPFTMWVRVETGLQNLTFRFLPERLLDAKEDGETWEYTARIISRARDVIAVATEPVVPPPAIEYIAGANSDNSTSVNIPAHQPNDLIIAYAKGSGVFNNPVLPSGWTAIVGSGIEVFTFPLRFYFIRDTAGTLSSLELPANTSNIAFAIYRNASGVGVTAITAELAAPTSAATPSLGVLSAGSWAIAGVDINQGFVITPAGGLVERVNRPVAMGGGTGSFTDTNGVEASYAGGDTFSWSSGAVVRTFAFELLNG